MAAHEQADRRVPRADVTTPVRAERALETPTPTLQPRGRSAGRDGAAAPGDALGRVLARAIQDRAVLQRARGLIETRDDQRKIERDRTRLRARRAAERDRKFQQIDEPSERRKGRGNGPGNEGVEYPFEAERLERARREAAEQLEREHQEAERVKLERRRAWRFHEYRSEDLLTAKFIKQQSWTREIEKYGVTRPRFFDHTAANTLVATSPPVRGSDVHQYVAGLDAAVLEAVGYNFSDAHRGYLVAALSDWEDVQRQADAQAQQALNAQAAQRLQKLQGFKRDEPHTWVLNPLQFHNGVTDGEITGTQGGAAILKLVEDAAIRPHGKSRTPVDPVVGVEYHTHLAGGSWGLAFIYILENDDSVTPCVYDISTGRSGNMYQWRNAGVGYTSAAAHPVSR